MSEDASSPVVAEIAELLNQCGPDELSSILQTIEGGGLVGPVENAVADEVPGLVAKATAESTGDMKAVRAPPDVKPVPPSQPPPGKGTGRRPAPPTVKRPDPSAKVSADAVMQVTAADMQKILNDHRADVLQEVRKMIPTAMPPSPAGANGHTMDILVRTLSERDNEVQALEDRLAQLHSVLSEKDQRVTELGLELDTASREVRHRQLDLEFQQLKLEERVRSNADLEQAQRQLTEHVEEANLNARHAALDVDMSRTTPRAIRAQGTLPWTLRKNRLPLTGPM